MKHARKHPRAVLDISEAVVFYAGKGAEVADRFLKETDRHCIFISQPLHYTHESYVSHHY